MTYYARPFDPGESHHATHPRARGANLAAAAALRLPAATDPPCHLNPGAGQYGGLKWRQEKDEKGVNYRCTEYEYAHLTNDATWLVNRPTRQAVKSGNCNNGSVAAETLYRYANSANPSDVGLDARGLLTWVLQWTGGTNYATGKRTYTANGLLSVSTTFSDLSTTTQYASQGRQTVTTTYTVLGLPQTVTTRAVAQDVYEQTQTLTYDTTLPWLAASVKDANNLTTRYGYDGFGRLTKVAMPGDTLAAPTMWYTYYDNGSTQFLKPFLVGIFYKGNARSVERQFYDGLGRLVQTQTAAAEVEGETGDRDIIVSVAYDARGLEVCRSAPYDVAAYQQSANSPFRPEACAAQARTQTTYDALGRPTSVTTPDGATTRTAHTIATTITVDGHTKLARTEGYDGNNHRGDQYHDAFGRLALVREFENDGAPYAPYADTRYSYDVLDNLTAVGTSAVSDAQPGAFLRRTAMNYDPLGRKTTMIDPDMGTWNYTYDATGNLTRQTQPGPTAAERQALCFYYDSFNRLIRRTQDDELDELADSCPAYNNSPASGEYHLASYRYGAYIPGYNNGRLVEVNWGDAPTLNRDTFGYDNEGRLASRTRRLDDLPYTYQVTQYDALNRPEKITLPSGEVVVIAYDQEGENSLTAGGTPLIDKVGYNERGQLTLLSRPGAAPETTLTYHDATVNFRLNKLLHGPEGGALPDFIYGATGYDAVGNIGLLQMKLNSNSDTYSFFYDHLNRLTTATLDSVDNAADYFYTYEYDELGNIMSRVGTDPDLLAYGYGNRAASGQIPAMTGGPQAVTYVDVDGTPDDWRYDYDTRGNLDGKYVGATLTYDYTFDVENRLESVRTNNQTTAFFYDADGQRVKATRPDGTVIYTPFPDYEVEDPPGGGANTVRTTYRLAGQIVAVRTRVGMAAGTFHYTYTDHLGSVVALSNLTGGYLANSLARYDPFGNHRTEPTTNPGVTNHGFTGHRHNNTGTYATQDIGLIYMNARYYLPEVGRFISPDSIVPEPGNPQSYNRYAYVLNAPTNHIDPSGHEVCTADLSEVECSTGTNLAHVTAQPSRGFANALARVPFTPTLDSDPREFELRPVVCLPSSGCQFVASAVPVYLANSAAEIGAPRSKKQIATGNSLDAAAAGLDLSATAVSGTFVTAQIGGLALGGPGLDDGVISAAYYQADKMENWYSKVAAGLVILGDFFSGESNISTQQVIIGQDSMALGVTAGAGELVGKVPVLGPAGDTAINLAVNAYDFGRLSGAISNHFEGRFDRGGFYVVIYPH